MVKTKLTPAGRLLLVERIEQQGWPAAHAAAMAGVARATAYKWLARWRHEGLAGLHDRSSGPQGMPTRTSPERETDIVELRRSWRRGPHVQLPGVNASGDGDCRREGVPAMAALSACLCTRADKAMAATARSSHLQDFINLGDFPVCSRPYRLLPSPPRSAGSGINQGANTQC